MRRTLLFLILTLLFICGCDRRAKLIPAKKMVDLYVDMFLSDQWLRDHPQMRTAADTSLFFDPIFARHGYIFEDYNYSLEYYSQHPMEFAEITADVNARIEREATRLKRILDESQRNEAVNAANRADYEQNDFSTDSSRVASSSRLWRPLPDSLRYSLWLDSLRIEKDSLQIEDFLDTVSVAATPLIMNSLKQTNTSSSTSSKKQSVRQVEQKR